MTKGLPGLSEGLLPDVSENKKFVHFVSKGLPCLLITGTSGKSKAGHLTSFLCRPS